LAKTFKLKYQYVVDYFVAFEHDEEEDGPAVNYVTGEVWEWDEIETLNYELLEDSIQVVED
jgi:hypothetical protein